MTSKTQEITMELIEKETRLSAESVAIAIESLIGLLRSIDSNMWSVSAPRYRWVIKQISMKSPLRVTMEAILTNQDAPKADVVGNTLKGLGQLNSGRGRLPKFFGDESLSLAKRMVSVYRDGVLAMNLNAPEREEMSPSTEISRSVQKIMDKAKPDPFDAYGSIDGVLRRVTVDDRPEHQVSDLQIIDPKTDRIVDCQISPEKAEALVRYLRQRVTLHGKIRYNHAHEPLRIIVEDFDPPVDKIPTLEELQELNIKITNGEDAADYIGRLRGDEE
jgi:hypothetical protein